MLKVLELMNSSMWASYGSIETDKKENINIQECSVDEFIGNCETLIADFSIKDSDIRKIIDIKRSLLSQLN